MSRAAWCLLAAAALSLGSGCIPSQLCDNSDEGNPPDEYTGGTVSWTAGGVGFYETSPWDSGWLYFPGGKRYDIHHQLGVKPDSYKVDFAFSGAGTEDGGGSGISPCAGNTCNVQTVDAQILRIKNDACAEFWIRVAIEGHVSASGAPDAAPEAGNVDADGNFDGGSGDSGVTADAAAD